MRTNKPYVKAYKKDGSLINPIERIYLNSAPNRKTRRSFGKFKKPLNIDYVQVIDFVNKKTKSREVRRIFHIKPDANCLSN